MRGRPNARHKRRDMGLDGDLKYAADFTGMQMSEYDVMFHIPYGPGFTAKKICKFVYQTDLGMNRCDPASLFDNSSSVLDNTECCLQYIQSE